MLTNSDIEALVTLRRALHRQPEVSGAEVQTAARMAGVLREAGAGRVLEGLGGHGVAGIWDSGAPGPTVMFRAELDALPIREAEGPDWRSEVEGTAHLCGHDGHMTILAGLARLIRRDPPARGQVILLMQPAEEDGSGAAAVIGEPRYTAELAPDWAFAIHNMPNVPLGIAQLQAGPANCASVGLEMRLTGGTAHAAIPETGRSPAPALARLIGALPDLAQPVAREDGTPLPGFRLVTVTHARLGEPAFGIAPGEATLFVTLRAIDDAGLEAMVAEAEAMARALADADRLTLSVTRHDHFAATTNDAEATALLADGLRRVGLDVVPDGVPLRASEDFGRFGSQGGARAAMAFVGAGDGPAVHTERYDFNEALIAPMAIAFDHVRRALVGPD